MLLNFQSLWLFLHHLKARFLYYKMAHCLGSQHYNRGNYISSWNLVYFWWIIHILRIISFFYNLPVFWYKNIFFQGNFYKLFDNHFLRIHSLITLKYLYWTSNMTAIFKEDFFLNYLKLYLMILKQCKLNNVTEVVN